MNTWLTCILLAGSVSLCAAQEKTSEFKTITANKFTLSYKVDDVNLVAKVAFRTKGYVAIGFNPTRKMKNGNFIIGFADGANGVVQDDFGVDDVVHMPDTLIGGANNVTAASCVTNGDTTVMSFTIPLDSGDPKDVKLEPGKEIRVIFAAGASRDFRKHRALGKAKITL